MPGESGAVTVPAGVSQGRAAHVSREEGHLWPLPGRRRACPLHRSPRCSPLSQARGSWVWQGLHLPGGWHGVLLGSERSPEHICRPPGPRVRPTGGRFAGFCEDLSGPCPVPPVTVLPGILGPCRVLADPVAAAQHGAGTRKSFKGPGCWGADGTGPRFPTELSVSIGASSSGRRTPKTGLIEA